MSRIPHSPSRVSQSNLVGATESVSLSVEGRYAYVAEWPASGSGQPRGIRHLQPGFAFARKHKHPLREHPMAVTAWSCKAATRMRSKQATSSRSGTSAAHTSRTKKRARLKPAPSLCATTSQRSTEPSAEAWALGQSLNVTGSVSIVSATSTFNTARQHLQRHDRKLHEFDLQCPRQWQHRHRHHDPRLYPLYPGSRQFHLSDFHALQQSSLSEPQRQRYWRPRPSPTVSTSRAAASRSTERVSAQAEAAPSPRSSQARASPAAP